MKFVATSIMAFFSAHLLSANLANAAVSFPGLTDDQPVCYGREYSDKHLGEKPAQTVKLLKLKFETAKDGLDELVLSVQAQVRRPYTHTDTGKTEYTVKPYGNYMRCTRGGSGQLNCGVECDGGTAIVEYQAEAGKQPANLLFKNQGFMLHGGCGEEVPESEELRLERTADGDSDFRLYALPKEFCQP